MAFKLKTGKTLNKFLAGMGVATAYQTNVLVNGIQSGVSNFSVASSAASAGRVVFGNIPIAVGGQAGGKQLSFQSGQVATGGGIAAYSFLMKYANLF